MFYEDPGPWQLYWKAKQNKGVTLNEAKRQYELEFRWHMLQNMNTPVSGMKSRRATEPPVTPSDEWEDSEIWDDSNNWNG